MGAELKIAYEGGEAERAARHFVDNSASAVAYKRVENACAAVKNEEVDFAVLPIESSTLGSIHANYDLLLKYGLHVVGEYDQQESSTPEQEADSTSYTRFLLLSKKEDLALDDMTTGVEFKTSLVFGFKDSTAKGMLTAHSRAHSTTHDARGKLSDQPGGAGEDANDASGRQGHHPVQPE
ncbi:hypothetical protein AM588_10000224 [Phytophthora nicotianae]|uniref:Prephenate dehydratase domain-containing protein n=1 Tax=Phytophthora nicotianae TaxID=4792 RepID=A0A0W8CAK7_PHYNI|nr:hypothetical protein AM588_10000224 [Phytophthora nicotianae]